MPWLDNTDMEETLTKTILHRLIKGSTFLDLDATILFFFKSALEVLAKLHKTIN